MKKDPLHTADCVQHMLAAIARIREYTAGLSPEAFEATPMAVDAVVRNLEIIGEAARNVMQHDRAFAAAHAQVPWETMYAMRNRISHGYFSVDAGVVWTTVQRDLPELQRELAGLALR